jgi:hypothetical protein
VNVGMRWLALSMRQPKRSVMLVFTCKMDNS